MSITGFVPPPPPHAAVPVELPERFPSTADLCGRAALVTGGGRGLGLAIACALAEAGARVAIAGRHREYLDSGLAELSRRGEAPLAIEADLSDVASSRDMITAAVAGLGRLDLLVNNAGGGARKPPEELTEEEYDRIFDTNVKGLYFASCEAAGRMSGGGSIINVASVSAIQVDIELAAYCASKAAVIQLTRALAAAWGRRGIRVNAIAPGYTDSPLNAHRKADPVKAEAVVGRTPLGRWGMPSDVAAAAVFLASDGAAFITGQTLFIEGGYMLAK